MKSIKKIALLSSIFALSLTSCELQKTCLCLETSSTEKVSEGMCSQVRRSEEVDTVYLINTPTNPEADLSEYTYDITWSSVVSNDHVSFTNGLKGKRIHRVFRISDTVILVDMYGKTDDPEATFGYIKISPDAFEAHTNRAKNAFLKAYVSISDNPGMVEKPSNIK